MKDYHPGHFNSTIVRLKGIQVKRDICIDEFQFYDSTIKRK